MNKIEVDVILKNQVNIDVDVPNQIDVDAKLVTNTRSIVVASGYSTTLTFEAGNGNIGGYYMEFSQGYDKVTLTNVASYTIYKNQSLVTIPFNAERQDHIQIEIIRTNPAQQAILKLENTAFVQDDKSKQVPPLIDKTRRHIFLIQNVQADGNTQYIAIIDTATDLIVKTTTLPVLGIGSLDFWTNPFYDNHRDLICVRHSVGLTFLEANPASPNFGDIVDPDTRIPNPNYYKALASGDAYSWYDHEYYPFDDDPGLFFTHHYTYDYMRMYNLRGPTSQPSAAVKPNTVDPAANNGNIRVMYNGNILCLARLNSWHEFERKFNNNYLAGDGVKNNWNQIAFNGRASASYSNGTFIYIPSLKKYVSFCGQAYILKDLHFSTLVSMGSQRGAGTSTYYQSQNLGDYDPVNKHTLTSHFYRQTVGTHEYLYAIDCVNNTMTEIGVIPGLPIIDSEPRLLGQIYYSHYSGKFYHIIKGYNIGNTDYINIYDIGAWIAGGKVSVNDLHVGTIDLTTVAGGNFYAGRLYMHKYMCGNWINIIVD